MCASGVQVEPLADLGAQCLDLFHQAAQRREQGAGFDPLAITADIYFLLPAVLGAGGAFSLEFSVTLPANRSHLGCCGAI